MEECQIQDHEISLSLCLFTTCFISDWITLIILFKHAQCLTKNIFLEHKRLGFYDSPNIFLRREQDYFFARKKIIGTLFATHKSNYFGLHLPGKISWIHAWNFLPRYYQENVIVDCRAMSISRKIVKSYKFDVFFTIFCKIGSTVEALFYYKKYNSFKNVIQPWNHQFFNLPLKVLELYAKGNNWMFDRKWNSSSVLILPGKLFSIRYTRAELGYQNIWHFSIKYTNSLPIVKSGTNFNWFYYLFQVRHF